MPWPFNGDCYDFDEAEIKNRAPGVTGVYGLYNRRHYILISHTNNIRESLLRHRRETRFRFRRLEPTGFTFEACSPEMRETRAYQLSREYQPVLRIGESAGLRALWRSLAAPPVEPRHAVGLSLPADVEPRKTNSDDSGSDEENTETLRRDRAAFAGTVFALAIVAVALFVLLGENSNLAEGWTKKILSFGQQLTALVDRASTASAPGAPAGSQSAATASLEPAAPETAGQRSSPGGVETGAEPRAFKSIQPADAAGQRSNLPWTVQALSTPDLKDAVAWHERLKAKGYDAFIVETEIKGKRWYRLRVGELPNVQKAEALLMTLRTREGFDDAFVAPNTRGDVILASTNQ